MEENSYVAVEVSQNSVRLVESGMGRDCQPCDLVKLGLELGKDYYWNAEEQKLVIVHMQEL